MESKIVENVCLSRQGYSDLITIQNYTRLSSLPAICRWAFTYSIMQVEMPNPGLYTSFNNAHVWSTDWNSFISEGHQDKSESVGATLALALKYRLMDDRIPISRHSLSEQFWCHLHAGLDKIAKNPKISTEGIVAFVNQVSTALDGRDDLLLSLSEHPFETPKPQNLEELIKKRYYELNQIDPGMFYAPVTASMSELKIALPEKPAYCCDLLCGTKILNFSDAAICIFQNLKGARKWLAY